MGNALATLAEAGAHLVLCGADKRPVAKAWLKTPATLDAAVLRARIETSDAVALIKVGRHLAKVRGILEELSLADGALYIERATMTTERLLPLAEAPAPAPYFSMVLVHRRGEAWR